MQVSLERYSRGIGPVTIKTNIATNNTQETFLEESNILEKFYHKNIISLYGAALKTILFIL